MRITIQTEKLRHLFQAFRDGNETGFSRIAPDTTKREAFVKHLLNGVRFEGGLKETAAKMGTLSYADIEHIVVEAVKTILLAERDSLQTKDLLGELRAWKASVQRWLAPEPASGEPGLSPASDAAAADGGPAC